MTEFASLLSLRLAFNGVDEAMRASLRAARPLIMTVLPDALDAFYAHVMRFPEAARFFRDAGHRRHAQEMQLKHWAIITEGRFDDAYAQSVIRIGEAHHRIGIEPQLYIGGYSFLLTRLLEAIAATVPRLDPLGRQRVEMSALQSAVTKAVLLDMDLAISVYLEAGRRDRQAMATRLATEFDTLLGGLTEEVIQSSAHLVRDAEALRATADAAAELSGSVTHAAGEAASGIRVVSHAAEELGQSITEISSQVAASHRISEEAEGQIAEADGRIARLSEVASRIGDVVSLISQIAAQTNLLALNATIEAARAGEAGRGFAVVANEVKLLATQTARATEEIGGQISEMRMAMQGTVEAIQTVGTTIRSMTGVSAAIAAAIEEQSATASEIAGNIQGAAQGTSEVSGSITQVSTCASDTRANANSMLAAARLSGDLGRRLREGSAEYLARVAAV
jgi:methyl-accepting chemotaxis protein